MIRADIQLVVLHVVVFLCNLVHGLNRQLRGLTYCGRPGFTRKPESEILTFRNPGTLLPLAFSLFGTRTCPVRLYTKKVQQDRTEKLEGSPCMVSYRIDTLVHVVAVR